MTSTCGRNSDALHTARLRLRRFNEADANALFALHSSAYVLRYWDAPPWRERVRAERAVRTSAACLSTIQRGLPTQSL